MRSWSRCLVLVGMQVVLFGCRSQESGGSGPDWTKFMSGFVETYFQANPLFAVYQGRHDLDGRFPDWSSAGLQKWGQRLHQLRDSAAAFPIDSADTSKTLERDYLLAVIDRDLFWEERADWPHRNPTWYADQIDPNVYLTRPYAPLAERMGAYTRWAAALPGALAQIRANLRTPLPKAYADIGRGRFGGLASYLEKDVPIAFDSVRDTVTRRNFARANNEAVRALKDIDAWLASEQKRGTNDYAMGRELFQGMLRS